ncbi:MAG: Hsp20/alpha crystallin family protein [Noviherbaspirillum sp.]
MNIIRRHGAPVGAYRPLMPFDSQFGRLAESMFEDFVSQLSSMAGQEQDGIASPRLDVKETEKSFELLAEVPGVKKDDLKISIDDRRVTIEAEVQHEDQQKEGESIVYAERSIRRFLRSITLPVDVDDAAAQAKLENGVLLLTLPKKEPAQAKKITVQ